MASLVSAITLQAAGPATIDPDAAASVLYFDRIAAFRRLETFVPTTPKPLLTVIDGVIYGLTHDWRLLVWSTIVAEGVAVALGVLLVARLSGGVARLAADVGRIGGSGPARGGPVGSRPMSVVVAAVLGAVMYAAVLTLSGPQMLEVSRANSLVWALAGWLAAGLALTERPSRYVLAGLALLFAGLIRTETWLLILPAVAAGTMLWLWRRRDPSTRPVAAAPLGLWLSMAAFPLWALHDFLLTGDPTFSLSVPARYTAIYVPSLKAEAPLTFLAAGADRYLAQPGLLLLALAGVLGLVACRRWWVLGGLVILFAGVLFLLTGLAARAVYVSARYYETPDLAALTTAAIGAGALAGLLVLVVQGLRPPAHRPAEVADARDSTGGRGGARAAVIVASALGGLALGAAIVWPPGPLDPGTTDRLARVRSASGNAEVAIAALAPLAPARDQAWSRVARGVQGAPGMPASEAALLVPSLLRSRLAVELDLPLTEIADSLAAFLPRGSAAALRPGQVVYHDREADPEGRTYRPLYEPFESGGPVVFGGNSLQPVSADPAHGIWIVRVAAQ